MFIKQKQRLQAATKQEQTNVKPKKKQKQEVKEEDTTQRKLEEFGEQFMAMFDDDDEPKSKKQAPVRREEEIEESEEEEDSSDEEQEENKQETPKITTFVDPAAKADIIGHKSLDGKEGGVVLTVAERKQLKRQKQAEAERQQKLESEERKKLMKGDNFDVKKASLAVRAKSDQQRELDKLWYETKQLVYTSTLDAKEYEKKMEEEKMRQGKAFKKIKGDYVNFKVLKEQFKKDREKKSLDLEESFATGTYNLKEARKERFKEASKQEKEQYKLFAKMGAPNDIGKADWKMKRKTKVGTGSVGRWNDGELRLNNRDLIQMGVMKPKKKR